MKEKIRIGFVGCGQFARNFVPLFQAHPACEYVAVCDKFRDRAENYMEKFKVDKIFDTYEEMLASDEINSVAIFSQRNQHGEMAIAALKAGKNVYSAVPMAARYNILGLTAHESALRGGQAMDVYDCGDPPAHLEILSEDREENEEWI